MVSPAVNVTPVAKLPRHQARIPALDGIRAVAVILVFGAHTFSTGFGWQGVQLFFVLSGFLITGILRRSKDLPAFWRTFYIKRATRILPPLVLFFAAGALLYKPPWKVLSLYALFAANIVPLTRFDLRNSFDVLWSLSVEEHFYLLWPFAVKFLRRGQLIALSLAICFIEPFLRMAFVPILHNPRALYMLTPFQLDGLAAGSLLALLSEDSAARDRLRGWSAPVLWSTLALYVALSLASHSFVFSADALIFSGVGYSMVTLFAASLLGNVYLEPEGILSRALRTPALVFLGVISYGFYLFHPLAIDFATQMLTRLDPRIRSIWPAYPVAFALAVLVSFLSFRFYESRLIGLGRRWSDAVQARAAAACAPSSSKA